MKPRILHALFLLAVVLFPSAQFAQGYLEQSQRRRFERLHELVERYESDTKKTLELGDPRWAETLIVFYRTRVELKPGGTPLLDYFGWPMIYDELGLRTVGSDGVDDRGKGDDLIEGKPANWGYWSKATWPAELRVLPFLILWPLLFARYARRLAPRTVGPEVPLFVAVAGEMILFACIIQDCFAHGAHCTHFPPLRAIEFALVAALAVSILWSIYAATQRRPLGVLLAGPVMVALAMMPAGALIVPWAIKFAVCGGVAWFLMAAYTRRRYRELGYAWVTLRDGAEISARLGTTPAVPGVQDVSTLPEYREDVETLLKLARLYREAKRGKA